jgi:hypothetical protein
MRIPASLIAVTLLGTAFLVHAKEQKDSGHPAVYRVEFDIRSAIDVPAPPSRHFSMLLDESRKAVVQAADRVPLPGGSPGYVDVGAVIECTVQESGGKADLRGTIELTSITGYVNLSAISQPIIGQRKLAYHATVELGTPAVIIGDSPAAAAKPRVEVTVTKMN